jgi:hypothetical protein
VIKEKDPNKWAPKAGGASEKRKLKEKKVTNTYNVHSILVALVVSCPSE